MADLELAQSASASTCFALASAVVSVAIFRHQFMVADAMCLAGIRSRERLAPRNVFKPINCFKMRRVLTGSMLARITARAALIRVVADVIYSQAVRYLIRRVQTVRQGIGNSMSWPTATGSIRNHAEVFTVSVSPPRPAIIRPKDIDFGCMTIGQRSSAHNLCHGSIVAGA